MSVGFGKPVTSRRLFGGRFLLHIYAGKGDHSEYALLAPAEVIAGNKIYDRLGLDVWYCKDCGGFHMRGVSGVQSVASQVDATTTAAPTAAKANYKTDMNRNKGG